MLIVGAFQQNKRTGLANRHKQTAFACCQCCVKLSIRIRPSPTFAFTQSLDWLGWCRQHVSNAVKTKTQQKKEWQVCLCNMFGVRCVKAHRDDNNKQARFLDF